MAEQEVDLTEAQERAVKALAGLQGACTLTALADALEARPNVVARTLGALERKEVVRRTDDEGWELWSAATAPERLELRYVPLKTVTRWDANPKHHDLEALIRSIETHGFGDPPKMDGRLGGLVYGNGRTEALEVMKADGRDRPRGIEISEDGEWLVPVIFGGDAKSEAAAVAFAVDHNMLVGGGRIDAGHLMAMWDEEKLRDVLRRFQEAGDEAASSLENVRLWDEPGFTPADLSLQSRLDEKEQKTCPNCGHVLT